jgi:hypothetical protein
MLASNIKNVTCAFKHVCLKTRVPSNNYCIADIKVITDTYLYITESERESIKRKLLDCKFLFLK